MRFLHTSDWHFGIHAGVRTLENDHRFFLKQLYEIVQEQKIDVVLCAGDVYDTSLANASAISLYNEAVTTICSQFHKKMLVIAGNHDSAARLSSCCELLKEAGLYVTGRLKRDLEPVIFGDTAVYSLPFFNRDEVIALFPEKREEIRSQEQAMLVLCDAIRERMDRSKKNVLVAHAMIVHAELSESDRSARVGFADAVSKEVLKEFDYVALGHIHKPQVISETIRYSGSPFAFSFGREETQEKGVVVWDSETGKQTWIPLKQLHPRKTLEGCFLDCMKREEYKEYYLKWIVTDRYAGLELMTEIKQKFPYLLELYGKGLSEQEEERTLSLQEIETLNEVEIMKKFFEEIFQYQPDKEQIQLFQEVLEWNEKEGELS